ncbi:methionyl-tRNA formyltransferase, mitochondrial-like [Xenia sp. Carnegie-2017]|uniref:methionyl-tRNA formyltransferase, mitochondrial-like n=1 Tax=Xenia sp. Carnegie-2017 TaxID=2897299 RepID=UPI001F04C606|nr:methionyl-tRNA formyltransferase, mitochondrial-like [Xenia sp. Carnegie-2017]
MVKCFIVLGYKKAPKLQIVREYALQNNIRIHKWPLDKEKFDIFYKFDLGIVVSFGYFIPAEIINNFPCGAINVHPSLLPRWRGPSPIAHTILQGDTETGVSVIELSPKKFDAGKILTQEKIQISPHQTYEDLKEELSELASNTLLDVLMNLTALRRSAVAQDKTKVTQAPKLSKTIGYIRWSEHTCEDILRLHKAIGNRFGLKCKWKGKIVKLETFTGCEDDKELTRTQVNADFGQFFYDSDNNVLYIKCKDGWIGCLSLRLEYRKSMSAKEFVNGYVVHKQTGEINFSRFEDMINDSNE